MNCLLGLTLPTSGELFAFGLPLNQHRIAILKRSNFSSAYTALPGNLLVWQNLAVFARIYGVRDPKKKIAELMEMLEISHLGKRVTGQLSAGESTRVNLVKAFLNDPELLIDDHGIADRYRRQGAQSRPESAKQARYRHSILAQHARYRGGLRPRHLPAQRKNRL